MKMDKIQTFEHHILFVQILATQRCRQIGHRLTISETTNKKSLVRWKSDSQIKCICVVNFYTNFNIK